MLVDDGSPPALAWVPAAMLDGIDLAGAATLLGLHDGAPRFAIDVSSAPPAVLDTLLANGGRFAELRGIAAELPAGEPAIAAQARSLVAWHTRHGFCAVCGGATTAGLGGGTRSCGACGAAHFLRIDPVLIVLVSRGDHALLVHGRGRPGITYTCIAGFMELGETIEEAVRREVLEEAGVRLAVVRYHSSQPWPFPSSLMIGCHAEAATEAIAIDPEEIDDARWFPPPPPRRGRPGTRYRRRSDESGRRPPVRRAAAVHDLLPAHPRLGRRDPDPLAALRAPALATRGWSGRGSTSVATVSM